MFVCVERNHLTAFGEERLDYGGAIGSQDPGGDFDLMVEARVGEDFEARANGTAFGVIGAVDEAGNAGLDDGASAHAAGLNGDVECGVGEAVIAEEAGSFAKDNDFGVGGGVAIADGAVAGTGQDLAVTDEDSTNGDFGCGRSNARFRERFLHELDLIFHQPQRLCLIPKCARSF